MEKQEATRPLKKKKKFLITFSEANSKQKYFIRHLKLKNPGCSSNDQSNDERR